MNFSKPNVISQLFIVWKIASATCGTIAFP